jgi:excisionase family DNA binding protein
MANNESRATRSTLGSPIARSAQPEARFLSVESAARIFDVSKATLYREIRCGRFPAIKVRGRYVVPARAVSALEDAAMDTGGVVDLAKWTKLATHPTHDPLARIQEADPPTRQGWPYAGEGSSWLQTRPVGGGR